MNYNFKEYYGLPLDQVIDAAFMKKFQQDMSMNIHLREKYNAKASGYAAGSKYYCQTYDTAQKTQ